jgi:hypothetical protein
MKKILSLILVVALVFSSLGMSFAQHDNGNSSDEKILLSDTNTTFRDVPKSHWAYEAIEKMAELGIINGYENGLFKPNQVVSRAEFAKMMVLALDLEIDSDNVIMFSDMKNHWALEYVNAAMNYLTGYSTGDGYQYKPNSAALREDMAVSLVRALGINVSGDDELDNYVDSTKVSKNLRNHVAAAIKAQIMVGTPYKNGKRSFNPHGMLTRAEAATLLMNVIELSDEEKIILGEDQDAPKEIILSGTSSEEGVRLSWSVDGPLADLDGFKIVASIDDTTPKYPQDGYAVYISNTTKRSYVLEGEFDYNETEENNLDELVQGNTYHFAITGLYGDEKVYSNTITLEYGVEQEELVIELEKEVEENGSLTLSFSSNYDDFDWFKVVASKVTSTPKYPEYDYYVVLANDADKSVNIQVGDKIDHDGESLFEYGENYYFGISASKDGELYYSNFVSNSFVEPELPKTLVLSGGYDSESGKIELKADAQNITFEKYILVASDTTNELNLENFGKLGEFVPNADGDYDFIISDQDSYTEGDFENFVFSVGNTYYFKVFGDNAETENDMSSNVITVIFE